MKPGDIITIPTEKFEKLEKFMQGRNSIHFPVQPSEQELAKSLEGKTLVAGEIVNGIQLFRIKRD
jgi:hypothetical protein